MEKYSKWKDCEVISLFKLIEEYKANNQSLLSAFETYAKKTKRQRNSVRNYYYLELKELNKNKERRNKLNIDINKHIIKSPDTFSTKEIADCVYNILKLKAQGYSVRKACLTISKNDISKMVRLQNKYRNIAKTNPEIIQNITEKLKNEGVVFKENSPRKNNIISMPIKSKSKLTDSEITSLFLGLVKLVKKCAKEEAEENCHFEINQSNLILRKSLIKINGLENENKNLTQEIENSEKEKEKLTSELQFLKTEIASLIQQNYEKLSTSKNYQKLNKFLEELKTKKQEQKDIKKVSI